MAGFFKRTGEKTVKGVKRTVGWKEIATSWGLVKDVSKQLDPRELRNKQVRVETFQSAYKRLNLTEKDLQANYQNLFLQFWIAAIFGLGSLALVVVYCVNGRWGTIFPGLGFLAICSGLMFKTSFRAFQYRHRSLTPVKLWTQHPEQWMPTSWMLPDAPKQKTMSEGVASALEREERRQRALLRGKKDGSRAGDE